MTNDHPDSIESVLHAISNPWLAATEASVFGPYLPPPPAAGSVDPKTDLEVMSVQECHDRLAENHVGRLAVSAVEGIEVLPVNYRFVAGSIVFRTGPGSKLQAMGSPRVSFEIDSLDPEHAWSVLVKGRLDVIPWWFVTRTLNASDLVSWVPVDPPHWMRVIPTVVSGRRMAAQPQAVEEELRPLNAGGLPARRGA